MRGKHLYHKHKLMIQPQARGRTTRQWTAIPVCAPIWMTTNQTAIQSPRNIKSRLRPINQLNINKYLITKIYQGVTTTRSDSDAESTKHKKSSSVNKPAQRQQIPSNINTSGHDDARHKSKTTLFKTTHKKQDNGLKFEDQYCLVDDYSKNKKKKRQERTKKSSRSSSSSDSDSSDSSSDSSTGSTHKNSGHKMSAYEKRKQKLSGNVKDLQFVSDQTRLECWMRTAIHDFVPNANYKHTVMYWATQSTTAAAALLFKRHAQALPELIERYGSEQRMLQLFGLGLRQVANNERAVQSKQIKITFMSKQNPETRMVENIIEHELDANLDNPPRLYHTLKYLKTIDALRELIISPQMYQYKVLFNLFCTGIENGNFRQAKRRPYKPLDELMTKAHEAHFRVELYFSLSQKVFRHINSPSLYKERIAMFNHVIN